MCVIGNNGYVWISRTMSDHRQQMLLNPRDEVPIVEEDKVSSDLQQL